MKSFDASAAVATAEYEDLFPAKLHYVLEQVEVDGFGGSGDAPAIVWQPYGRAFLVNDRETFVQLYLPNWFRQTTWASFQRQLNHYEFRRITSGTWTASKVPVAWHHQNSSHPPPAPNVPPNDANGARSSRSEGPEKNAYYHPCFVKGDRTLCKYIRRIKLKGNGPRKASKPEDQPNFYQLPLPDPISGIAASLADCRPVGPPPFSGAAAAAAPTCVARPRAAIRRVSSATHRSLPVAPALRPTLQVQAPVPVMPLMAAPGRGGWLEPPVVARSENPSLLVMLVQEGTLMPMCLQPGFVVESTTPPPPSVPLLFAAAGASTEASRLGGETQLRPLIFFQSSSQDEGDGSSNGEGTFFIGG